MASKELLKSDSDSQTRAVPEAPRRFTSMNKLQLFLIVAILPVFELWYHGMPTRLTTPLIESSKSGSDAQLVRSYNLTIGSRWMNQGSKDSLPSYLSPLFVLRPGTDNFSRWRSMAPHARMQRADAMSNFVR